MSVSRLTSRCRPICSARGIACCCLGLQFRQLDFRKVYRDPLWRGILSLFCCGYVIQLDHASFRLFGLACAAIFVFNDVLEQTAALLVKPLPVTRSIEPEMRNILEYRDDTHLFAASATSTTFLTASGVAERRTTKSRESSPSRSTQRATCGSLGPIAGI
jgi:hypothetical protein